MVTTATYKVKQDYSGKRNILVPTRMYSRNSLLNSMHIKTDKYLGVNLDKYALTFHKDKTMIAADPEHEIAFSKIKSMEADVTKADSGKYYLKVHTDEGDLKFKFNNARDFHSVVEALRNTIHNDKPFYDATDSYKQSINAKPNASNLKRSNSEISSDEEQDFKDLDAHKKKAANQDFEEDKILAKEKFEAKKSHRVDQFESLDEQKKRENKMLDNDFNNRNDVIDDDKKDQINLQKGQYHSNKEMIESNKYRADLDQQANKELFKRNKEIVRNEYDLKKEHAKKHCAKDQYEHEKQAARDIEQADLSLNKDIYRMNKDCIKQHKHIDEGESDLHHDKNKKDTEFAKENIKADAKDAKQDLKAHYKVSKDGIEFEKDNAKNNMKADVKDAKLDMKDDIEASKQLRDARC
jgi:hypothetical protein